MNWILFFTKNSFRRVSNWSLFVDFVLEMDFNRRLKAGIESRDFQKLLAMVAGLGMKDVLFF